MKHLESYNHHQEREKILDNFIELMDSGLKCEVSETSSYVAGGKRRYGWRLDISSDNVYDTNMVTMNEHIIKTKSLLLQSLQKVNKKFKSIDGIFLIFTNQAKKAIGTIIKVNDNVLFKDDGISIFHSKLLETYECYCIDIGISLYNE